VLLENPILEIKIDGSAQSNAAEQHRDVEVSFHGSINLLTPLSRRAEDWLAENVGDEENQWWGDALVTEPRYTADIVQGMIDDGLAVFIGDGQVSGVSG
jgi:hypothetical protein